jgi:hypothetical protein
MSQKYQEGVRQTTDYPMEYHLELFQSCHRESDGTGD